MKYTITSYFNDMGSFAQPGCKDMEDFLWHLNKAREHDGLAPLKREHLNEGNCQVAIE